MHIADGFLPPAVWISGYGITGLATWLSLQQIQKQPDPSQGIPKASLLTAAFFVASSLYIPIPPASVHLVLNGLLGVILGAYAFPAILIGLFFQAVMFGHGGISTLGVNAALMGLPALLAGQIFRARHWLPWGSERVRLGILAFLGGAVGLGLAALIFYGVIVLSVATGLERATEQGALLTISLAYVPLMILEGGFTCFVVLFLHRVKPELLPQKE